MMGVLEDPDWITRWWCLSAVRENVEVLCGSVARYDQSSRMGTPCPEQRSFPSEVRCSGPSVVMSCKYQSVLTKNDLLTILIFPNFLYLK